MRFFYHFGKYILMLRKMIARPEKVRMYWREWFRQMNDIGIGSLGIITVISVFIGAVTCIQFAYNLEDSFVPMYYVGFVVRDSMILELAPTMSCLLLAGKVGSSMATELGTMRISEQIDALEIMGINTTAYLVGPKILAALIVVPMLICISAFLGIYGGLIAGTSSGLLSQTEFIQGLQDSFVPFNVQVMLIKAATFAFIITSVSCFQGFYATGGALEIGKASTRAVVFSSILIIISDYVIAWIVL